MAYVAVAIEIPSKNPSTHPNLSSPIILEKNRAEQEALNARIDEAFLAQPEANPDASQLRG